MAVLHRLEVKLRASSVAGRSTLGLGPFAGVLAGGPDSFVDRAVPRAPESEDERGCVDALCRTFEAHQRRPRLG